MTFPLYGTYQASRALILSFWTACDDRATSLTCFSAPDTPMGQKNIIFVVLSFFHPDNRKIVVWGVWGNTSKKPLENRLRFAL